MSNALDRCAPRTWLLGAPVSSQLGGFAVNGTYTFGSAGNVLMLRFVASTTSALNDVYAFVNSITGTGGTLTVELRNYGTTSTPGSTLLASTTVATGVATTWYKATFASPATLTQGVAYYLLFTSNDASNFVQLRSRSDPNPIDNSPAFVGVTSSNGASTGSVQNAPPSVVLVYADGTTVGSPYTAAGNDTSNSRERGIKVTALDAALSIGGAIFSAATAANTLKIYASATAPGGTALLTVSLDASAAAIGVVRFAPYTLQANTTYRVVLGFSGNSTAPGYTQIQDNTTYAAALDACGLASQGIGHTIDNGSGGWTDATDRHAHLALLVTSQQAGGGAIGGGNLSGGFQ